MNPQNLLLEVQGPVALIRLHRPRQLNALNDALMDELAEALAMYDADDAIGCIVLTGSEKAFAAGADIAAMAEKTYMEAYREGFITRNWERMRSVRKPVIAAVAGYCLGGGCELAMMCDFIIAGDDARFGQPEIRIGTIPGAGGTQRLPRAVGKSKAMDMVLTARMMDAAEAERAGLVSRVVPAASLLDEAMQAATAICAFPRHTVMMAKECVHRAFETPLSDGLSYERHLFHSLFGTHDQREGMAAFLQKREPKFEQR